MPRPASRSVTRQRKSARPVQGQVLDHQGGFCNRGHARLGPNGADRFYNLVKIGYFDDAAFFRNVEGLWCSSALTATLR